MQFDRFYIYVDEFNGYKLCTYPLSGDYPSFIFSLDTSIVLLFSIVRSYGVSI